MAFLGLWIEPYPFSKRTPVRFDGGKGQLDIVELATCFLELGDSEAALGTLPLSSLVYITRTEIGFFGIFNFIGRLRAYLIGAHVAGLVIPWAAGNAWAIGGSHGSHWGNRRWELTYDILRWFAIEIYTYFVTKSKHSASFPSFLSCIEFRFRRTAWCTPGTAKQQTEFIFSTCIAKYVSLVFAVVHCFSIFFSWIKVNEVLARVFLQTE